MSKTKSKLVVAWFSAGVSSFVATLLSKQAVDRIIYIDINDQHPDSLRFVKDCEEKLEKPIEIMKSHTYASVDECIRSFGFIRNPYTMHYPCTSRLKKDVRKRFEAEHADHDITYIWGFDIDESQRIERLKENMPEQKHVFPLLTCGVSKQDAHAVCERIGIKRPTLYDIGYNNNNCLGCVKGGMGYWNKIRIDFPQVFENRARLERDVGNSILSQCYLDELDPDRGRMPDEIMQDCSIFCQITTAELNAE